HFIEIDPVLEGGVHVAQLAVRSEQRKRSASDATRHRRDQLLDGQVKPLVLWQRKICGQTHQSLVIEVEGRGQDQLLDLGTEADARSEVVKSSAHRKRRGREHRGTPLRIDPRPQQRADIDWSRLYQSALSPLHLPEPVHADRVRTQHRFIVHTEGRLEAAAYLYELKDASVRRVASVPPADTCK